MFKKIDFGLFAIILLIVLGVYFLFFSNLESTGSLLGGGRQTPKHGIFR